jgi:transcriptional regulator GlxA family with amidase domain
MTSAVFGQADAFAVAASISERRTDASWSGHDVRLATPGGKPVRGYGGHLIEPDCSLADADDSHVVLIPPIFNDIEQNPAQEAGLVSWLASFRANSKLLASSCTGAFLLAEAGILDGRRVTTNAAFSVLFQQRYPGVRLALDERIVDDNTVICAGATTAYLNLAIHVIDRLAGHDLSGIDRNPESQRPYFLFIAPKDHGDDEVLRLLTWIEVHHRDPISIDDMVGAAGMSVRNLNRRFLSATAMSARQYLRRVRIETTKRLLEEQNMPVDRHRPGPDMGGSRGRGRPRAFGTGYHPIAELTRCGWGDAGDGREESSGVFRTVRAKREHPRFGARLP